MTGLWAAYRGRKAELVEDTEAVIDILSGRLRVSGEAGAWVKVGTLDDDGTAYLVQPNGEADGGGVAGGRARGGAVPAQRVG